MNTTKLVNAVAFMAGVIAVLLFMSFVNSRRASYPYGVACYQGGTRMSDGTVIYDCRNYEQTPR